MLTDYRGLSPIRLLAMEPRRTAVQQLIQHCRIVHVRHGRRHGMDQLGLAVHAGMQLHPEIPLPAFAGWSNARRQ